MNSESSLYRTCMINRGNCGAGKCNAAIFCVTRAHRVNYSNRPRLSQRGRSFLTVYFLITRTHYVWPSRKAAISYVLPRNPFSVLQPWREKLRGGFPQARFRNSEREKDKYICIYIQMYMYTYIYIYISSCEIFPRLTVYLRFRIIRFHFLNFLYSVSENLNEFNVAFEGRWENFLSLFLRRIFKLFLELLPPLAAFLSPLIWRFILNVRIYSMYDKFLWTSFENVINPFNWYANGRTPSLFSGVRNKLSRNSCINVLGHNDMFISRLAIIFYTKLA